MKITVFGLGYIGTVTAACLSRNHSVVGVDIAKNKVDLINAGRSPIIEPGIDRLIQESHRAGRLRAYCDSEVELVDTDVVIICVGTPSNSSGEVDLTALINVTKFLSAKLKDASRKPAIVYRSTVLPGTMEDIVLALYEIYHSPVDFPVIYHPEFLREGSAVKDFCEDPQIVVAPLTMIDEAGTERLVREIYKGIDYRYYCVGLQTAEMIKYLNNTFHALKVVFANEVARLCSLKNVDTHQLFRIFLEDRELNISEAYLKPGFAFGGSCLPKDLRGIMSLARRSNVEAPILTNIERSNEEHIRYALKRIMETGIDRIGFYGLSFKPETDDVRESPYVKLIEDLIGKGKDLRVFDESIRLNKVLGRNLEYLLKHIPHISQRMVRSRQDLIEHSDLIVQCHYNEEVVEACRSKDSIVLLDMTGKLKKQDLSRNIRSLLLGDAGGL